ncbi:MAG: extracellular solute-binding protein [Gorillibacterium sp.]|nr:extracellular solute-binding protein [Gorillibacterium sp.]
MLITTACGGTKDNASSTGGTAPAKSEAPPVTISVQYAKADNPVVLAMMDEQVKSFQEKYPNVIVKKDTWQYSPTEIGIKMAAHQAPSTYGTWATEGKTLVGRNWAADLTEFMNNYPHAAEFNEALIAPFMIDNKQYAIPESGYVLPVTINKKLFADKNVPLPTPDWTWDDFYAAAKATADPAKGIAGFAIMAKGNEGGWNWTNFLYQAGGTAQTVADGKVVSSFNSEAGVKAMEFLRKLRWEGNALPQNWALNYGDTTNLFKQGRAAMILINDIEDAVNTGGMDKDDLLVLPMPSMEKGGEHIGVMGGQFSIINPEEPLDVQQAAFNYRTFSLFQDTGLELTRNDLKDKQSKGQVKMPDLTPYYKPDSEYGKKAQAVLDEFKDTVFQVDPEVSKLMVGVPEPAYNGQDYYAALTNVMQQVLSEKDTDIKVLLDAAAKKFDAEVLSKVKVE